jgi:hypothetical protein
MMTRMAQMQAMQDASEEKQLAVEQRRLLQSQRSGLNKLLEAEGYEPTPKVLAYMTNMLDPKMAEAGLQGLQQYSRQKGLRELFIKPAPAEMPEVSSGAAPTNFLSGGEREAQPLSVNAPNRLKGFGAPVEGDYLTPGFTAPATGNFSIDPTRRLNALAQTVGGSQEVNDLTDRYQKLTSYAALYAGTKEADQALQQARLVQDRLQQLMPKIMQQDLGGSTRLLSVPIAPGATATEVPGSNAVKTMTPGEGKLQTNQIDVGYAVITQEFDPKTGRTRILSTSLKGLTPDQARQAAGEANIVAHSYINEKGEVTNINKFGRVITPTDEQGQPTTLKAAPSATFEKARELRQKMIKDLDNLVTELSGAIKPGGLLEQSTGSGIGVLRDAAGNFVGYATEGSIALRKLEPIADLVLKMVPRFEGPQSDKDTASYTVAAGQLANGSLPVPARKAAAEVIVRLMTKYKNGFITKEMESLGLGGTPGAGVDTNNPLVRQLGGAK